MSKLIGKIGVLLTAVLLLAITTSLVFAGNGLVRIDPANPVMLESPAAFSVYVNSGPDAHDAIVFLAMTDECHTGLTDDVMVSWEGGSIAITAWTMETVNSVKLPPNTENGVGYTVSSLQSHLETEGPIWWASAPILDGGMITQTPQDLTVELPSTAPEMLVYALGIVGDGTVLNVRVPPTIPGFVVPEATPVILAGASFAAMGLYAFKRKKH